MNRKTFLKNTTTASVERKRSLVVENDCKSSDLHNLINLVFFDSKPSAKIPIFAGYTSKIPILIAKLGNLVQFS